MTYVERVLSHNKAEYNLRFSLRENLLRKLKQNLSQPKLTIQAFGKSRGSSACGQLWEDPWRA